MARRSKEQLKADRIIKKQLLKIGDEIYEQARETSRVSEDEYDKNKKLEHIGGTLRDSINYRVVKDTTLKVWQVKYGKWNFPKGKKDGDKNALLIAVNAKVPDATAVIISEITSKILIPFKK